MSLCPAPSVYRFHTGLLWVLRVSISQARDLQLGEVYVCVCIYICICWSVCALARLVVVEFSPAQNKE